MRSAPRSTATTSLSAPLRGATLALSALLATSACSSPETAGPYAAEYAEAQALATNDFEKAVLADGLVTRAEYEEAHDLYLTCMTDAGFAVRLIDQEGYYVYGMAGVPGVDEANTRCMSENVALIGALYVDQLTNPNNEDYDTIIIACMVRAGLVDTSYTKDQFTADSQAGIFPFDAEDPAFHICMANPSKDLAAP